MDKDSSPTSNRSSHEAPKRLQDYLTLEDVAVLLGLPNDDWPDSTREHMRALLLTHPGLEPYRQELRKMARDLDWDEPDPEYLWHAYDRNVQFHLLVEAGEDWNNSKDLFGNPLEPDEIGLFVRMATARAARSDDDAEKATLTALKERLLAVQLRSFESEVKAFLSWFVYLSSANAERLLARAREEHAAHHEMRSR